MKALATWLAWWRETWHRTAYGTAVVVAGLSSLLFDVHPFARLAIFGGVAAALIGPLLWFGRKKMPEITQPVRPTLKKPVPPPDPRSLVEQMLEQGRYGLLLRPEIRANLSEDQMVRALESLMDDMTAIPGGLVGQHTSAIDPACDDDDPPDKTWSNVPAFYLDRYAVTNEQFAQFVLAGGYETRELWYVEVWPAVSSFVDRDGKPGPRYWKDGGCPYGKERHPVVGVSWYEAAAYARWLGKRLPTDAEWQKAGSCPVMVSVGQMVERRFPWGDSVDRTRANIWGSGPVDTVPVDHYAEKTLGGIHQMVGNVWEWVMDDFGVEERGPRNRILLPTPMKAIRGGAFDTYFDSQATCQFQSGENPMSRRQNVGFRLALSVRDLEMPPPAEK